MSSQSAADAGAPRADAHAGEHPSALLAYHIAVLRGANVDQPRNPAKSVTVE
ncbi:MAG TPA: hypothetical protein VHG08_24635 [Longimicrobium sp.]|nr:hypothetical protein [Longimicrobium sp.]